MVVECKKSITDDVVDSQELTDIDDRLIFDFRTSRGWLGHPDGNRQSRSVFELKDVRWSRPSGSVRWTETATRQWMKSVADPNALAIGIVREVSSEPVILELSSVEGQLRNRLQAFASNRRRSAVTRVSSYTRAVATRKRSAGSL